MTLHIFVGVGVKVLGFEVAKPRRHRGGKVSIPPVFLPSGYNKRGETRSRYYEVWKKTLKIRNKIKFGRIYSEIRKTHEWKKGEEIHATLSVSLCLKTKHF